MSESENYTPAQKEWLKRRGAVAAGKPNAIACFKNIALTVDGVLCLGMSYSAEHRRYSCTYTETDGVRDFGGSHLWDCEGGSLDCAVSDLNMKTIHESVRRT